MVKIKGRMKKLLLVCMMAVFFVFAGIEAQSIQAANMDDSGMDIVIVVDTSGSMSKTDSDRLAIEAAKLFVDMMETEGSKVALVPFSHELENVIPMTEIHSQSDKHPIKKVIDGLKYEGDTDIGLALKKAKEILDADSNSENKRAILFFTDGKIDLPSGSRTNEESRTDALNVASAAAEENIPIYTIGLNSNGNVDTELIKNLSATTDGRNYIVDDAEVLPQIFDEIFADFINSNIISLGDFVTDGVNFVEIPFSIENNSVLEANIIMLSDKSLSDIQVINPDGNDIMSDTTHAIVEESERYTLLKLITPKMGDWNLKVKGDAGCKVHVNLIFNYKVSLQCNAELVYGDKGANIEVVAWMDKEGNKLTDSDLYQAFTGKVYLENPSGKMEYEMTTQSDSFTATIPADDLSGSYNLYARIESESMYRESVPVVFDISNSAPAISGIPTRLDMEGFLATKEKFKIAEHIVDAEGDKFEVVVESADEKIATGKASGKKLVIAPKGSGETVLTIKAIDAKGAESIHKVTVTSNFKLYSILVLLLLVILVIAAIAAVIFALVKGKQALGDKNAPFYGTITWSCIGGAGGTQSHRLDYDRGNLPLGSFIFNPEASEMDLKNVIIHMNKTCDGILVMNKSRKCSMVVGYGSAGSKKADIRSGEFIILEGKYLGADVTLQINYKL